MVMRAILAPISSYKYSGNFHLLLHLDFFSPEKMDTRGGEGVIATIAYRPSTGRVIYEPRNGIKYVLLKVIGTWKFHFIYQACYYTRRTIASGSLLPTGYTTIKYLRRRDEDDIRSKRASEAHRHSDTVIVVHNWSIRQFSTGFLVGLPHMSEGSLRYILSTRFHYGLPEDCIAIALKHALLALFEIHHWGRPHRCFSTGNIYVNFKPPPDSTVEIKLGYGSTIYDSDLDTPVVIEQGPNQEINLGLQENSGPGGPSVPSLDLLAEWASGPEVYYAKYCDADDRNQNRAQSSQSQDDEDGYTAKTDIWLVGIAALELAYGNLRISHRKELEGLIKKIKRRRKLPDKLEHVLEEVNVKQEKGKRKKVVGYVKDKMKVVKSKRGKKFSDDFEKLVMDCLSSKPSKRPSVQNLLQRPFLWDAKDLKYFQRRVLYAKGPMPYC